MRDAEIGDLHRAVGEQEHVRGLHVAMHDALAVRVVERVEDLRHDAHGVGHLEALVRLEAFLQLATFHELHRDEPRAAVDVEIVDRDDVRMREAAGGFGLAAKAREQALGGVALQLIGADRLQRDRALDQRVEAFVDDAHRTAAELAAHLVLAELFGHRKRGSECCFAGSAHSDPQVRHLYLLSISQTDFCTSRCTIVSSDTPPCCEFDTPITDCDFAPTSIFSSV